MMKYKTFTAALLAAVFFPLSLSLTSPAVLAQVEVVALEIPSTRSPTNNDAEGLDEPQDMGYSPRMAKPSPASMTEFYFQIQTLQQEVQALRGLVEEQSFQLKKLKQQRLDDYLDLDRRLSGLSQGGAPRRMPSSGVAEAAAPSARTAVPVTKSVSDATLDDPQAELALYRSGIDAVLKERNYDTGLQQFEAYLQAYPAGIYAANAKYWLGQVYLQREDLSNSARWFNDLIKNHPNHQKTPEAQFKLGKVLHLQGDVLNAEKQLKKVVVSGSSAAKLAQDYLTKHF